jgi:hypothetical protein
MPGQLIEAPFILVDQDGVRLFVSVKPHPAGVHAIYMARGRLVVDR